MRTYHILRELATRFDVTALCFYRAKARSTAEQVAASIAAIEQWAQVEAFPIPQERSRPRLVWDHVRSVLTGRAYTRYVYESAPFRRRLREILQAREFDLVHVDSLDLCGYLPLLAHQRVICTHHNVESMLLHRRADNQAGTLQRAYLRLQARLTEREERRWCGRVAANVAVSDADAAELRRMVPSARFFVVPNGVDVETFVPEAGGDEAVTFIGGTEWFPNVDALDFFCDEVLPILRDRGPTPSVRWVGRASAAEQQRYREAHDVELTGYVDDIRPFLRDALCTIVPLRIGGGTRLKITTAWALGKPVVSTSIGCEGLNATDGENILIRDTPEGFAAAILQLAEDPVLRRQLGRAARRTAEHQYSWKVIGADLIRNYAEIVGLDRPRETAHPDRFVSAYR
jgi:glycosyltransferase involved in cell wall biosynthesis